MDIKIVDVRNHSKAIKRFEDSGINTRVINISGKRISDIEVNKKLTPKSIVTPDTKYSEYLISYKNQLKALNKNKVLKTLKHKKYTTVLLVNPFLSGIIREFLGLYSPAKKQ